MSDGRLLHAARAVLLASVAFVAGCGGGTAPPSGAGTATYTVGGSVSGLAAGTTLVLQNNGGDNLTVTANGTFTFATKLASGATYRVTLLTQPAGQTCNVHYGTGTVGSARVTSVDVFCGLATIGGTLSGLAAGSSIVLQNGADTLTLTANGPFTFATRVADLSPYNVTILTPAAGQPCTSLYGAGNVRGANVTSVSVLCGPAVAGLFSAAASLAQPRARHTATLLSNGRVLVAGGYGAGMVPMAGAELYDPATNTWSAAGALATPRFYHTATLLPNGKVLLAGGWTGSTNTASAELYDPATNTWSPAASLATARSSASATLLPSGQVLVAGGLAAAGYSTSTELYDPASNTWSAGPSMATTRSDHTATLLASGKVLVAGGFTIMPRAAGMLPTSGTTTELYDPETNTWSAGGNITTGRAGHSATLLPNGKVLMAGGATAMGTTIATAELYDPATNAWSAAGSLASARSYHTATVMPGGKVVAVGGETATFNGVAMASAELYDPATNAWAATGSLAVARYQHTATLLPSGKLLLVGGRNNTASQYEASCELYW
jgi:N-acetylneuraminic acid mutarotase